MLRLPEAQLRVLEKDPYLSLAEVKSRILSTLDMKFELCDNNWKALENFINSNFQNLKYSGSNKRKMSEFHGDTAS